MNKKDSEQLFSGVFVCLTIILIAIFVDLLLASFLGQFENLDNTYKAIILIMPIAATLGAVIVIAFSAFIEKRTHYGFGLVATFLLFVFAVFYYVSRYLYWYVK